MARNPRQVYIPSTYVLCMIPIYTNLDEVRMLFKEKTLKKNLSKYIYHYGFNKTAKFNNISVGSYKLKSQTTHSNYDVLEIIEKENRQFNIIRNL